MTQLERLKRRLPDDVSESELEDLLEDSKDVILMKRFPFGNFYLNEDGEPYVENQYKTLQIKIAVELFNREGAEGETSHTEKDISRNYENAYVSDSLLNQIVPVGEML